jgi:hypothetical protein
MDGGLRGEAASEAFVAAEATASRIRWFEPLLIPGLLQTPEYARAVLESLNVPPVSGERVEAILERRAARQEALLAADGPACAFVVAEAALSLLQGFPGPVMDRQCAHLRELAGRVEVRVLSAGCVVAGMLQPFVLLDGPRRSDGVSLHLESAALGDSYVTSADDADSAALVAAYEVAFEGMLGVARAL